MRDLAPTLRPSTALPLVLLLAVALPGCDLSEEGGPRVDIGAEARETPDDADDVFAIQSRGDIMKLGLTRESIYMRFSDEQLAKIDREMENEAAEAGEGLAGRITSAVTGAVSRGLRTRVAYDLANVSDVRWEDGRLVIELREGGRAFDDMEVEESDVMAQFAEEDARAFIDAWREVSGG